MTNITKSSNDNTSDNTTLGQEFIRSLCFLYQEALKAEFDELANILETTLDDSMDIIKSASPDNHPIEDSLLLFSFLKKFRRLEKKDRLSVIDYIEKMSLHMDECSAETNPV